VNGQMAEVLLHKHITFRERQVMMNTLMANKELSKKLLKNEDEFTMSGAALTELISKLADYLWADKNYKIDDVEGDSLSGVLIERFDSFLGSVGYQNSARNNTSSVHKPN
jgi:hypothetical protein